jgi:hypothetical protein
MKSILIVLCFSLVPGLASAQSIIAGWKPVQGMSETEAARLTEEAIAYELAVDEDGEICGVDEVWGLERDRDSKADRPQRGEIFAVIGYARGPDMGCSITRTFDCRVVFNRPPGTDKWQVEFTYCEPVNPRYED